VTLNTGKSLPKILETFSNQSNGLPVFNIAEQTVLVQSVYVKLIRWGSLHLSATLATGELKILVQKGLSCLHKKRKQTILYLGTILQKIALF
jgi:hypothetical protein